MQEILQQMMAKNGEVKREIEARLFGQEKPSRGYYIVIPESGVWYLHHDGFVRQGVNADISKPAFWPTEEDAKQFFNTWRSKVLSA